MDYREVDNTASELAKNLDHHGIKKSFSIPHQLRFPIIWTIFFILIGITLQSISNGYLTLFEFFGKNFIAWMKSLGNFTNLTTYQSQEVLLKTIFSKWYYFFYTGGLLSLIWGFFSWLINKEISLSSKEEKIVIESA